MLKRVIYFKSTSFKFSSNRFILCQKSFTNFNSSLKLFMASSSSSSNSNTNINSNNNDNNINVNKSCSNDNKSFEKEREERNKDSILNLISIGHIETPFLEKNGCPRQPHVLSHCPAKLKIDLVGAHDFLDGLENYSHVIILFHFHLNDEASLYRKRAKIRPPMLDGKRVGIFGTRTPHRPNPIGLTTARLDKIVGDTLYLNGTDLVSGTPIFDIKPYIPRNDSFPNATIPSWVQDPPVKKLNVRITELAEKQLKSLFDANGEYFIEDEGAESKRVPVTVRNHHGARTQLRFFQTYDELMQTLLEVMASDTRSVYRRQQIAEQQEIETQTWPFEDVPPPPAVTSNDDRGIYGICLDVLNLRCRFDASTEPHTIVLLKVEDWSFLYQKK